MDTAEVLIIGGLSFGIVNEVAKYKTVESIVQLEQHKEITDLSMKYFPRSAAGYICPKLKDVRFGDYEVFLQAHLREFDVIITVPDNLFFDRGFCQLLKNSLKPGGTCISKIPTFWMGLDDIAKRVEEERELFSIVKLAFVCIPTFSYGQVTFVLRNLNGDTKLDAPLGHLDDDEISQMMFYNADVHSSSFALPQFVRNAVGG